MSYAEGTTVTVEKSKAELENVVRKHGGYNFGSAARDDQGLALIFFTIGQGPKMRQVRVVLPLPKVTSFPEAKRYKDKTREQRWEQACRERWRLLVLAVRAKLELVAAGASTIDAEFLAGLTLPDGQTVMELVGGAIAEAYQTGKMPLLTVGAPEVQAEVIDG